MLDVTIFTDAGDIAELNASWAIYDPAGATSAELAKIGFSARAISRGDDLVGVDALAIGSLALDAAEGLPFTVDAIRSGLRVVIFEQSKRALTFLGLRAEDVVSRYVFPRCADHPLLAGISSDDLVNWRGEGRLVPTAKRNYFPVPDKRLHWGNYGSVASVVVETPHRGAFTPILDAEFDLSYSPLLQWTHGNGQILFVQLDLTSRIGLEPAADQLARNIIKYADNPPAEEPAQDKRVSYVGGDGGEIAFLQNLNFRLTTIRVGDVSLRTLGKPRDSVVILGRDVPAELPPAARRQIDAHVNAGGTVLLLPQTGDHLDGAAWPHRVVSSQTSQARVANTALATRSDLLSGVGPQLLHWRTFLDLDAIEPVGLPSAARRLLDGLLVDVPDRRGRWIYSQLDWRAIDTSGANTRRTRWNLRKYYCQLLTNLGAETADATATSMIPRGRAAPLVNVVGWRTATFVEHVPYARVKTTGGVAFSTLVGLEGVFATDPWPETSDGDWGRVLEADEDGLVDLTAIGPGAPGNTAYSRTYVYSRDARRANVSVDAATWLAFKVNGETIIDQGRDGTRFPFSPGDRHVEATADLRPGWNRLEILATANQPYFNYSGITHGFWVRISDPGDIRVEPAPTDPSSPPPSPGELLPERPLDLLYTEPLQDSDDMYAFMHW